MVEQDKDRLANLKTLLKMFDLGECYYSSTTRQGKKRSKPFVLRTKNYRGITHRITRWTDYVPTTLKTQFQTIEALEERVHEIINAYQHWVILVDEKSRRGMK